MLPAKEFAGWRIAVAESDRFGGTCLNRGCIPSKMLVHTADVAQEVRHAGRFGVRAKWAGADWPAIRDRVFGRIDPLHERAVAHRRANGTDVFLGEARFVAPKVLQVGEDEIRGERFVLAAKTRKGVRLDLVTSSGAQAAEGEVLLVATGRVPNSDRLGVAAAGIETDEHGHVVTDGTYQTNVPGIWALGDLANHFQLKHMANAERRLVRHNLLHPGQPRRAAFTVGPSAVFAGPQVASVGATEQDLRAHGRDYVAATRPYRDAAYGWALEDTTSFVKVLADPATRLLLGAHIIGPQASTLIQPLIQAMCLGSTADQVASGVLYIHPALTEVVEQALLEL